MHEPQCQKERRDNYCYYLDTAMHARGLVSYICSKEKRRRMYSLSVGKKEETTEEYDRSMNNHMMRDVLSIHRCNQFNTPPSEQKEEIKESR